jgi:putative ABC transport system permease protein
MLMDRARGLLARWAALWRHDAVERELDDEFRFHLEMATRQGITRGLSPIEAARQAHLALGGIERHKEAARDARGLNWLEELRADMRHAFRLLRAQPGFSVAAILTLALGIGANTAIFSAVKAVLLAPSPFASPDRIVMLWETDRGSGTQHEPASWPDVVDFRARSRTLSDIGAIVGQDVTLTSGGEPVRVSGVAVTPNFLSLLGVHPLRGRVFTRDEGEMGAAQVVMLGEDVWRARFNADPGIVGTRITVNERPAMVVGIVPSDADLGIQQVHDRADYAPAYSGGHVAVWEAFQPTAAAFPRQTHPFLTIGRLAPNATVGSAQQELAAVAAELEHAYPENLHRGVNVERYSEVVFAPVRTVLYVLLAAVTLVLLVTCANFANLLLARTTARAREVALRRALGASAGRIRRQFLAEAAVLVLAGALAGVGTAFAGLRALVALAPADVPRLGDARIDGAVLLYTLCISAAVAGLFGLLPTVQSRRVDIQDTLKAQSGRASESRGARRFRSALVVGEVALAVALVAGAGLLLRSVWQLENVKTGFETANIVQAQYQLPATRFPIDFKRWPRIPEITQFHARYLDAVRAIPGVQSAALAGGPPIDPGFTNSFTIVGREAESAKFPEIRTRFLTPGYLATLGVPLLAGRDIGPGDDASAPQVVLINHAAAERYFAGRNPIGQQIRFWGTTRRIVGVMGDERFEGLEAPSEPAVYGPMAQNPQQDATLLVRVAARGDPMAIAPALRRALHDADPQVALYGLTPLQAAVSRTISGPRFSAALLAVFGGAAVLLALVGVHGMLSYTVAQRRPEMGIRMALGASGWNVMRLVVGEGVGLAVIGVAAGLALALAGSRAMTSLVFGITATDPATFATVAVAVLVTSALASIIPALRAVRVDAMEALRAD